MAGGDQTITTAVKLPEWQDQAWQDMTKQAQALAAQPYEAYTGDMVANGSDIADIAQSQEMIRDIANSSITGLSDAQAAAASNMDKAAELGDYNGVRFTQYEYDPNTFSSYDYTDPGSWTDSGTADAYMSPYMSSVVANEQQNAIDIYNQQQASRDAAAVEAGAFGGSRSAVVDAQATADLNDQLAEIQASGLQDAYTAGQSQYNTETTQNMTLDQQRAADQARVQAGQMTVQEAQAAELARTQAAKEQSKQFGAQQGLDAIAASNASAQQVSDLGQVEYNTNVSNASLLEQQGRKTQVEKQAELDAQHQAWLDEQNYGWTQLQNQAGIVSGTPSQPTTATTQPGPSTLQTIAGLGEVALGAAGIFMRKGGLVPSKKRGIARLVK